MRKSVCAAQNSTESGRSRIESQLAAWFFSTEKHESYFYNINGGEALDTPI